MNKPLKLLLLIVFILLGIGAICFPLIIMSMHFNSGLSSDLTNWAQFGDYLGGTMGTIVSLLSLILLGYISVVLHNSQIKEQVKLSKFEKQMGAIDGISGMLTKFGITFSLILDEFRKTQAMGLDGLHIDRKRLVESLSPAHEFRIVNEYFRYFEYRFNKIFDYDFKSEEFKEILKIIESISLKFDSLTEKHDLADAFDTAAEKIKEVESSLTDLSPLMANFLNSLNREIEIPKVR